MASRNVKPSSVHGYDSPNISDKMQSSTLKRQPNPDWSKADLLRLLSYFEGELQARDIAIAALKAEKAKQLLYQAKYGRFGLGDPFIALQRDADCKNDGGFDEAAIKSMYDNQLAQLENLIATQRKAQLKMREQLGSSEKRFHKVCTELEEEKQKHAQDTAQGDDVTYMLEKERERLKAEIDFEKSQNKKLEKDLKKSLASLEEERANSARHKQVAIMLIKERKHLIERIVAESQIRDEMETALTDGKSKIQDMAEGLAQESKKALKMEAAMEKQNTKFDAERETLRVRLQEEEKQTKILKAEVTRLSKQLESLQVQIRNNGSSSSSGQLRSSVSPARAANSPQPGRGGAGGVGLTAPGSSLQSSVVDSTSSYSSLEPPLNAPGAGVPTSSSGHPLEFLGPEMANLQQVLAAMTTDETHSGNSLAAAPALANSEPHPSAFSPVLAKPLTPLSLPEFASLLDRSPKSSSGVNLGQNNNRNYFNFPSSPKIAKEQHSNATDCMVQGPEVKKTVKVTAQVWPLVVEPVVQGTPNIGTPVSTPTNSCIPRIIFPSSTTHNHDPSINSIPVHSIPSANFIPAHVSNLTAQSAAAKRRSIPPRSRSKSPLKAPNNHTRSCSASGRISSSASVTGSSLHQDTHWFLASPETAVIQPSPAVEVSRSPIHEASAQGKFETLLDLLARNGGDVNKELPAGTTPLHCAAENNQTECVHLLLEKGAKPSSQREDKVTPLHLACLKGFTGCANHLLNKGAAVNASTSINQTPLHLSVKAKHIECCQLLLRHGANILFTGRDGLTSLHYAVQGGHSEIIKILLEKLRQTGASRDSETASRLVSMTDKDGWSLSHMSARLPRQDCLVLLNQYLPLDFESRDKLGRSVGTVASAACKEYIGSVDQLSHSSIKVTVELRNIQESTTVSSVLIGYLEVRPSLSWKVLEDQLRRSLTSYLAQLDVGLKTRRIARLDTDFDLVETDMSLGLTMDSIRNFEIGHYKWTPGVQTSTSPYGIMSDLELRKVAIIVDDSENVCELIAFDVLHPVSSITNYLRLLDQYKSLIFYGPSGSGKSYLAHRLAQSIAAQELSDGRKPAIYQLDLQPGLTHIDFLTYLKQRNCVLPVSQSTDLAPILLLDNLESVDIAELFGGLLDAVEHRGKGHAFNLPAGSREETSNLHYLANQFYLIGTMNKSRSLGVDLSILPRFRWIQFRLDTEPLRGLLARHYFRRLLNAYQGCMPAPDEPVFRAIEWVVCAWHRLNESLHKLGIPEVIQGPCLFFKCPLEKLDHRLILQWMKNMWNNQIGPGVREAVKRGTGSESPSDGQQKVANTALYVLMQRSVILSCPLSGQEKEAYFAGFMGSNELDIPLKSSDGKARGGLWSGWPASSPRNSHHQRRPHVSESLLANRHKSERDVSPNASPSSATDHRGGGGRNGCETPTDSSLVAQNIKRRSLSDSSVNSSLLEQQQQIFNGVQLSTSSQAKVAKLEIKSTKVVNITSAFISPSLSPSQTSDASWAGGVPLRKTGRVSPLLTLVANKQHASPKKSKSSENISGGSLYGQPAKLRSCGLFSFSLTTPSNLSSFKFLDSAKVESGLNLADQMPDFSVFDKVPTPTDELPSKGFGFTEKLNENGKMLHNTSQSGEHQLWGQHSDVFKPIYTPGVEDVNGMPRHT